MAQLFLQICNFIDNLLKFNQIRIYRKQINILHTISGLRALAP
jgi:hypothetical protein